MTLLRLLDGYFWTPAPAERLAALRLLVGGFSLGYVLLRAPNLMSYAGFTSSQFQPVGVVSLLSGPLPDVLVRLLVLATALAGVAFVAGWRFRLTGPLFAVLLLWVTTYRNSFGQVFHTENLMVLHVLVLACSPAADALSLDSRGLERPADGRYGAPIRLMCILTVITYVIAAQTKLRIAGLDWVTTDSLRNHVAYDNLRKAELGDSYSPLAEILVAHGWLFRPLAALGLLAELLAPLALLGGRVARAWVPFAWLFHVGVLAFMAILFPYPLLGVAFATFFTVETARHGLRRMLPAWRKLRAAQGAG